jgi:hypothetical protein
MINHLDDQVDEEVVNDEVQKLLTLKWIDTERLMIRNLKIIQIIMIVWMV